MRQMTFTNIGGHNTLTYLCTLVPSDHILEKRIVHAEALLAAKLEYEYEPQVRITFGLESEARELLYLLGWPMKNDPLITHVLDLATNLRMDELKASRV